MSNALATLTGKLANRFDMGDGGELINTLKNTAFRGQVSDAQMVALLVVANHVRIAESGCVEWIGAKDRKGYGQLTHQGKHQSAHRFVYANFVEPIRQGMLVLHHCDNPSCVNPAHLYQGTHVNNRADMLDRKRWSHPWASRETCKRGHNYERDGFSIASDGSRVCKICQRDRKRAQRAILKGE